MNGKYSVNGHDYRSDFGWIMDSGFDWVITDTADVWAEALAKQGKRNVQYYLADNSTGVKTGYYRRHVRDFHMLIDQAI